MSLDTWRDWPQRRARQTPSSSHAARTRIEPPLHLYVSNQLQEGVRLLGEMGLSFDAWSYHPQVPKTM